MIIRQYQDDDYWPLENLTRSFLMNDPYSPPLIVRYMQTLFGSFFYVAYDINANNEEEICGYIMGGIEYENKKKGWILCIFVREEYRNRGIGSLLVETEIQQMRKKGICEVFLTVDSHDPSAIRIYQKNGFKKISQQYEHYRKGKTVDLMKYLIN